MKKIKIYRMPLSCVFPATHPRAGEPTNFQFMIEKSVGICIGEDAKYCRGKVHTIRAINPQSKSNWFEKIKEVQEGKAVLVLYKWKGKPYSKDGCSNLFMFGTGAVKNFIDALMKSDRYKYAVPVIDSGIGTQELLYPFGYIQFPRVRIDGDDNSTPASISTKSILPHKLADNDGLFLEDFYAWFKGYDLKKPMVIIQFTNFRY